MDGQIECMVCNELIDVDSEFCEYCGAHLVNDFNMKRLFQEERMDGYSENVLIEEFY